MKTPALSPSMSTRSSLLTSWVQQRAGMVVTLMDWGATLLPPVVPLFRRQRSGSIAGCASPEHYPEQTSFLGASIGRYANRNANSRYTFAGETVQASFQAVARTPAAADRRLLTSAAGKL